MTSEVETYCRLCAEPTPEAQMIKSDDDVAITSKISTKMLWINVDVSTNNYLPKTICFSCFDLLEKTWHFLHEVRNAQERLYTIYAKKIQLPPECKVQPLQKLSEAGKPVNRDWDEFKDTKSEVKDEIPIQSLDEITTVDPRTLLNGDLQVDIKIEQTLDDGMQYNDDLSDGYNSSDSDQPLLKRLKLKRSKKKKKRIKNSDKEVDEIDLLPNPEAEAIPLDMSLYNMSWEDYTWQCANCDAQCKSVTSLRLHSLEIHSCCCIFKCSDCNKTVTNYKAFTSHVRLHYKHLKYWCEFCNKNFSMPRYLKKHKILTHKNEYCMSCPNCGTVFETSEQLQDHILLYAKGVDRKHKKQRDILDKEVKCDMCEKEFKSISNLRAHKLLHTERSRDFSCHVCGKMFFTKGALKTHMSVHEDVKPYKCEFCQMAFKARGNLISHISLHSGAKPFICEQCGKSFRVKRHLKSHSIVHTDLMPYSCEYCNKQFRFKTRLNLHLRQHTGSRPYNCFYCQRNFTNGSNHKKHMKRRHNIDTSKKKFTESVPTVTEPIQIDIINVNTNME